MAGDGELYAVRERDRRDANLHEYSDDACLECLACGRSLQQHIISAAAAANNFDAPAGGEQQLLDREVVGRIP